MCFVLSWLFYLTFTIYSHYKRQISKQDFLALIPIFCKRIANLLIETKMLIEIKNKRLETRMYMQQHFAIHTHVCTCHINPLP